MGPISSIAASRWFSTKKTTTTATVCASRFQGCTKKGHPYESIKGERSALDHLAKAYLKELIEGLIGNIWSWEEKRCLCVFLQNILRGHVFIGSSSVFTSAPLNIKDVQLQLRCLSPSKSRNHSAKKSICVFSPSHRPRAHLLLSCSCSRCQYPRVHS